MNCRIPAGVEELEKLYWKKHYMCSVGQVVSKEMIQSHLSSSIRFHSKDISFEHSDISRIVVLHKHLTVPLIRL